MSDFSTEQPTPHAVQTVGFSIYSRLERDEEGAFTDVNERLRAFATLIDENGRELDAHNADHTKLLSLGLLTTAQVTALQDLLQTFRADVEALLLPAE